MTGYTVPYSYYYYAFFNFIIGGYFTLTGILTFALCLYDIYDSDFNDYKKQNDIMFSCITMGPPKTFFGNYY